MTNVFHGRVRKKSAVFPIIRKWAKLIILVVMASYIMGLRGYLGCSLSDKLLITKCSSIVLATAKVITKNWVIMVYTDIAFGQYSTPGGVDVLGFSNSTHTSKLYVNGMF